VLVEHHLSKFGFDPNAENKRPLTLQERKANLESYLNESVFDLPVSHLYHYWFDGQGKLYSDGSREKQFEINGDNYQFFDPRERAGLPGRGFEILKRALLENPDRIVLWYSPVGKTDFNNDSESPYSQIKYDYGQLYVNEYDSEMNRVNVVAIKVSNEKAVQAISQQFSGLLAIEDEEQRIAQSLLNPIVLEESKENFFHSQRDNFIIYQDRDGNSFTIKHVLHEAEKTFAGYINPEIRKISGELSKRLARAQTADEISGTYLAGISLWLHLTKQHEVRLRGSCGGAIVTQDDILRYINGENSPVTDVNLNIFSSDYRLNAQAKKEDDEKSLFTCPGCGKKFKPPVGDCCPGCGLTKQKAAELGLGVC